MKKLLCVVLLVPCLLLVVVTLAAGASSSSPISSSLSWQHAQVLGRKGRELDQYRRYQHEGKHTQNSEEVVMEVKTPVEKKAGWMDPGVDGGNKERGLIYNADYEGVAMHAGSPPKHKHPKP